uniref:Uncharacterized protein n=1 Tax=Romanomermis culicivorax TaxID=13658 RepID=A0A915JXG3_ROMCU
NCLLIRQFYFYFFGLLCIDYDTNATAEEEWKMRDSQLLPSEVAAVAAWRMPTATIHRTMKQQKDVPTPDRRTFPPAPPNYHVNPEELQLQPQLQQRLL